MKPAGNPRETHRKASGYLLDILQFASLPHVSASPETARGVLVSFAPPEKAGGVLEQPYGHNSRTPVGALNRFIVHSTGWWEKVSHLGTMKTLLLQGCSKHTKVFSCGVLL